MAEIAVITPMYNAAATVGQTIDSVLAQSFDDWELYLMDDGSSDDTVSIVCAKAAGDPRIKTVCNGRVGHIGTLRNRALAMTSAPLACFLDADDLWEPQFLENQRAVVLETSAAVVHCAARHLIGDRIILVDPKYRGPAVCGPPSMIQQLVPRNPIYSPSIMIRTEVLRAAGGFSEHPDHISVLDIDLWLRLAPKYRFAYNPRPLLTYRISPNSLSGNPKNLVRNCRGEMIAIRAALGRNGDLPLPAVRGLRHRLGKLEGQYARALLDERPTAAAEARSAFRSSFQNSPFINRFLVFQLLSLLGEQPPATAHRLLRRIRNRRHGASQSGATDHLDQKPNARIASRASE